MDIEEPQTMHEFLKSAFADNLTIINWQVGSNGCYFVRTSSGVDDICFLFRQYSQDLHKKPVGEVMSTVVTEIDISTAVTYYDSVVVTNEREHSYTAEDVLFSPLYTSEAAKVLRSLQERVDEFVRKKREVITGIREGL